MPASTIDRAGNAARDAVVLTRNGDTAPRWKPGERLHHLFESAAEARPDAIAVETGDGPMSLAALEAEANRLARMLQERGMGADDIIALLFGRSVDAYIALLAVLKINAAYVPLDPSFPNDRICFIAKDAGARAVLTQSEHASLAAAAGLPVVDLDATAEERRRLDAGRVTASASRGDLAYIIYTSGSTGRPKGVRIEHSSIINFVRVAAETYGYRQSDRVYQGLTLAFDFSVEETWVPLLAGATLVPSQSRGSLAGADLHAFLAERRITALCCVPTLLATIEEDLPELRLLIVSGEACPEEVVRRWHRPDRVILNAYGPTEATVTATVAQLHPDKPVTLGIPLASYTVVILDPIAPRAMPCGSLGEIGIAGICLSPGYVGCDDLTQKAFIEDFISLHDNPSGRIYRTGDLGSVNASGQLEYHGRIDTQVKIRGYRIELAEVESVIMQQPGIVQAVVEKFEPEPSLAELVAYYTTSEPIRPEHVARALQKLLPAYMVPAFYEPLDAIPMLPCDKVNRKALPRPSGQRLVRRNGAFVAPQSDTELRLGRILGDLLKLERVSVTDDFFGDLGANSLLMARLSTRIRAEFEVTDIGMRVIYLASTVRTLAEQIDARQSAPVPDEHREQPHVASDLAYWGTGVYQLLAAFAYTFGILAYFDTGLNWTYAQSMLGIYPRSVLFSAVSVSTFALLPVCAKWLLIGRWRATRFPIWGVGYARLWTVKVLIRWSPLALMAGTPLYNAYLKMLGARVDWSAVVLCAPPVCTDLVEIGAQAVVGRDVMAQGYKAISGRIVTGPVVVGARAFVGDGSVLDINTRLEEGAELAHASALHEGQTAMGGLAYHGSPAEVTAARFRKLPPAEVSLIRRVGYSLVQLASWVLIFGPAWVAVYHTALKWQPAIPVDTIGALSFLLGWTCFAYFGSILLHLAAVVTLPRLAWLFLHEGRIYRLFGLRHYVFQVIVRNSNSKFFNLMFGDSSYIIPYLRAVGYRFPGLKQTGSNFGVQQHHDVPFLCEFGSGTMVSDSLVMANAEFSNAAFRLGEIRFGEKNFLGNEITYPAAGRTGDNVLFATKSMVPIEGVAPENTGLLGSPAFAIPRSVVRDPRFERFNDPDVAAQRLRHKNRYNLETIALFLAVRLGATVLIIVAAHALFFKLGLRGAAEWAIGTQVLALLLMVYLVLVERCTAGFKHLVPRQCSIYESYFWWHERYWKLSVEGPLTLLAGTPFQPLLWRAIGLRIGRKVYDGGCGIPERSLVTVGDYCTLNANTTIQAHSLEDGIFKSDRVYIGRGVTLGVKAFVHYGTTVGDNTVLDTDCFLMKGEEPAPNSRWLGNPARPVSAHRPVAASASVATRPKRKRERVMSLGQSQAAMEGRSTVGALR